MNEAIDAPFAPKRVAIRFPAGPGAPSGASFGAPNALLAVGELVRRVGVHPEDLEVRVVEAFGNRLALIAPSPAAPERYSRIVAFVVEGLSLMELQLALAWWRSPPARELRAEGRA